MGLVFLAIESLSYSVSAYDDIDIDSYWLNDTSIFQIDTNGIISNKTDLSVGNYYITIYVNDTSGNEISAGIKIEVQDNSTTPTDDDDDDGGSSFNIPSYPTSFFIGFAVLGIILLKKRKSENRC